MRYDHLPKDLPLHCRRVCDRDGSKAVSGGAWGGVGWFTFTWNSCRLCLKKKKQKEWFQAYRRQPPRSCTAVSGGRGGNEGNDMYIYIRVV